MFVKGGNVRFKEACGCVDDDDRHFNSTMCRVFGDVLVLNSDCIEATAGETRGICETGGRDDDGDDDSDDGDVSDNAGEGAEGVMTVVSVSLNSESI